MKISHLILIPVLTAIIFTACATNNHYENGKEYLNNKRYTEALSEFQQVPSGEKNYRLSQSKIAYIQGLQSFNDSLFNSAEVQLQKVAGDDEYFHEAQLMLDKINQRKNVTQLPKTDTLIIREEITGTKGNEKSKENVKIEVETDETLTKKFISQEKDLIEKFESLYQSAYSAGVDSKKNYIDNMKSVVTRLNALSYNAKEKDAEALELKQKAVSWMNKRVDFINRLISDNSVKETNTSRSLKEEGDKMYYGVTQQMKKIK